MDKIAEKLAEWFGSAPFILFHVFWFTVWIVLHFIIGLDPEWSMLTLIVSLEAIFLSLFILRAENVSSRREERNLKEDVRRTKQIYEEIKQTHYHVKKAHK